MPKSTISDILAAMSLVNKLDKHGKLAILRELHRQNLHEVNLTKGPDEEKEDEQ